MIEYLMIVLMVAIKLIDPSMELPDKLPKVDYMTSCELYSYHRGDECPDNLDDVLRPEAVYDHDTDTIILVDTFDSTAILDQSILLHELVHYMQDQDGKALLKTLQGSCVAEAWEKDAYRIQFTWLEKHGLNPFVETGLNPISLKFLTSCGSHY